VGKFRLLPRSLDRAPDAAQRASGAQLIRGPSSKRPASCLGPGSAALHFMPRRVLDMRISMRQKSKFSSAIKAESTVQSSRKKYFA